MIKQSHKQHVLGKRNACALVCNHHAPRNIKKERDTRMQALLFLNFKTKRKSHKAKNEILKANDDSNVIIITINECWIEIFLAPLNTKDKQYLFTGFEEK